MGLEHLKKKKKTKQDTSLNRKRVAWAVSVSIQEEAREELGHVQGEVVMNSCHSGLSFFFFILSEQ